VPQVAAIVDGFARGGAADASAQLARATETVLMLAGAAEAHDHTTGGTLQRVSESAGAGARTGHEAVARELKLAAVLHDIGKIRAGYRAGQPSKLAERGS
jgi:response regulator RpfG family c-di-GMP phosphodiesterase